LTNHAEVFQSWTPGDFCTWQKMLIVTAYGLTLNEENEEKKTNYECCSKKPVHTFFSAKRALLCLLLLLCQPRLDLNVATQCDSLNLGVPFQQ
jgi:hypothetical protein